MVTHIIPHEKHTKDFINFINKSFNPNNHRFYIYGMERYALETSDSNIIFIGKGKLNVFLNILNLVFSIHFSDKVIIHGLFSKKVLEILNKFPWLLKKTFWVIWGGDLYSFKKNNGDPHLEKLKKDLIPKIPFLISYLDEDVQIARDWYKAKGKHLVSIGYPSNIAPYIGKERHQ